MSAFPALPLGRRPIRCRLLAVYRVDPDVVAAVLPDGLEPRLVNGHAIAAACYTRLGATRLFRLNGARRGGGSDHLAYRFAVQREDGSSAAWIARRETSSWLEARCGAKLLRGDYGRSAFRVREEGLAIELTVEGEEGEEFYLRGENAAAPPNSLFRSPQALEDVLGEDQPVRPFDVFAPEADELDLTEHYTLQPLVVFEARSAFLRDGPFAGSGAELDGAWRLSTRRLAVSGKRKKAFRILPEGGSASPAMPTP